MQQSCINMFKLLNTNSHTFIACCQAPAEKTQIDFYTPLKNSYCTSYKQKVSPIQ